MVETRCATNITGFDEMCQGGLISDSLNLVMGNPGSGKTTFSLQFLYNGAAHHNEPGLYITFENEVEDLNRAMKNIGLSLSTLEQQQSSARMYIMRYDFKKGIKRFQDDLVKFIADYDIKRICLDPINIFTMEFPEGVNLRKQLFDFLNLLRKLNVCVLISGELDEVGGSEDNASQEIHFTNYLVDGVIQLYSSGLSGVGDRAVRIPKMRMTKHVRGPRGMELTDSGMVISSK